MNGSGSIDERGLGQRLQEARRAAGLTQQALCQKANISYSTLAKIERGAIKSPSIFTIQNLVVALDGSLDQLLGIAPVTAAPDGAGPVPAADPPAGSLHSKNGINFVYFDVNGCLVHFFQRAFTALARDTGASMDAIESVFWNYNADVCRGRMAIGDFNAALAKATETTSVDWESYYLDAVEPVPGMAHAVAWAAKHYRVGLLTNIMPGFLSALRTRGVLPDVDYDIIIDSSEVGSIKPEPHIFQVAAEHANVAPTEILLVDDDNPNLMAAKQQGWHVLSCDEYQPEDTVLRIKQALELV